MTSTVNINKEARIAMINTETEIYSFRFKSQTDVKRASHLLAEACMRTEQAFGKKRVKEVGMMRSDRTLSWLIEAGPGSGDYIIRLFREALELALGKESFKVDILKAETSIPG